MKKLTMMLVVLALLMAFPAAAGAKKPPQPPGQEPFPGQTCEERTFDDPDLWYVGTENQDFELALPPNPDSPVRAACIDVSSFEGVWNFKIEAADVASFNMQIKDSVPGDMCWRDAWTETKKTYLPDSVITPEEIPAATFDACPGDDFTDEAASLVFMVAYTPTRGTTGNSLTVCVDLPPFNDFCED